MKQTLHNVKDAISMCVCVLLINVILFANRIKENKCNNCAASSSVSNFIMAIAKLDDLRPVTVITPLP